MESQARWCMITGLALLCGCPGSRAQDVAARCTSGVFSYKVDGLRSGTQKDVARCKVKSTQLHVLQVAGLSAGAAILTISDAAGKEVYSHDANQTLSGYTAEGAAGEWVFQLQTTGATGAVEFVAIP